MKYEDTIPVYHRLAKNAPFSVRARIISFNSYVHRHVIIVLEDFDRGQIKVVDIDDITVREDYFP